MRAGLRLRARFEGGLATHVGAEEEAETQVALLQDDAAEDKGANAVGDARGAAEGAIGLGDAEREAVGVLVGDASIRIESDLVSEVVCQISSSKGHDTVGKVEHAIRRYGPQVTRPAGADLVGEAVGIIPRIGAG